MYRAEHARRLTIAVALFALAAIPPSPVQSHAHLTAMQPADGAVVSSPPETLRIAFSEPIEVPFSRFALVRLAPDEELGARRDELLAALADNALPDEAIALQPVDATGAVAEFALAPDAALEPGRYIFLWRVLSIDGHHTAGSASFEIAMPAGR